MKKKTIILWACFVCCTGLFAQQNRLNIGITAGPNYSSLSNIGSSTNKQNAAAYFSAGVYVQYHLPKVISFVTGVAYEGKRTDFVAQPPVPETYFTARYTLHYLTVPLLVRATFGKKYSFFVNAGGFVSPSLSAEVKAITNIKLNYYTSNVNYLYKHTDAGLVFGLGCGIPLSEKFLLSFELRNNLGLVNVNNYAYDKPVKTNSTSLLIGLAYKIGKR